jgi:HK97 family phage major capsid protein
MILNPADLEILASTVTTGSGQLLVSPDPVTGLPGRLWGVDLVVTSGISSGTALVAATDIGTVLFSRMAPENFAVSVQQAQAAGDIFLAVDPYSGSANNLVRVLCEERIALGVTRPTALCKVTFNGTT